MFGKKNDKLLIFHLKRERERERERESERETARQTYRQINNETYIQTER